MNILNNKLITNITKYLFLTTCSIYLHSISDSINLAVNLGEILSVSLSDASLTTAIPTYPITEPTSIGQTSIALRANSSNQYNLILSDTNNTPKGSNVYLTSNQGQNRIQLAVNHNSSELVNLKQGTTVLAYRGNSDLNMNMNVEFFAVPSTNNVETNGIYTLTLVYEWTSV